jgi:hypothetical protein
LAEELAGTTVAPRADHKEYAMSTSLKIALGLLLLLAQSPAVARRSHVPQLPEDADERNQLVRYLQGYVAKQGPLEGKAFTEAASALRGDLQYPMVIVKRGGSVASSTDNARRAAEMLNRAYSVASARVGRPEFGWALQLVKGNVTAYVDPSTKRIHVTIQNPGAGELRSWEFTRSGAALHCVRSGRYAPGWIPTRIWTSKAR